ncbi:MAG: hypothetical protein NC313_09760 [Butyrivibrio sp.]|nr:hypothetical protein [Butyrivibrio sp.]
MSLKQIYRDYIYKIENKSQNIRIKKQWIMEWKGVLFGKEGKRIRNVHFSHDEIEQIQDYWKEHYGKKIPLYWHKKYYAYSGKLDVRYFPEYLYTTKLETQTNPDRIARILCNKAYIEFLYAKVLAQYEDLTVPKCYGGCGGGCFYDGDRNPISRDRLVRQLAAINQKTECIIKPTVGESSGHGVDLIILQNGQDCITGRDINDIFNQYKTDFIIQEKVKQEAHYTALHPESCNTLRIMTYRVEDTIKAAPPIMRIGRGKSHLDNAHAGGMYIALDESGILSEYAHDCDMNTYEIHPDTNIKFEGYRVPMVYKAMDYAKKLHACLPDIGFANWDFCINDKNQVVIIEGNLSCPGIWLFENTHGCGVFGDDTEYMVHRIGRYGKKNE